MQIKTVQFITSLKKQARRNQFWNNIQNSEKDSRNVMKRKKMKMNSKEI